MKFKYAALPLLLLLLLWVGVCNAAEAPLKVEIQTLNSRKALVITSIADSITVKNIVLNRGNLNSDYINSQLPKTLKYGERLINHANLRYLEVRIDTDQGSWTFTFN